jgi:hypothetical protein
MGTAAAFTQGCLKINMGLNLSELLYFGEVIMGVT